MDPASTIDFARGAMLTLLEIIAPCMITALVVGLGIGLLQAVTQIQEQTLVFVPKIVATFVVLLICLPFAGSAMMTLMNDIAGKIPAEMHITLPALSGIILTYLLVFSRVGAMVMLLPAIGEMGVPSRVRLILALAITFALTPQVQGNYPGVNPASTVALVIMIVQEVTAGVLVGAMARIIMSALQIAGSLIATQIGLAYAQTIDPTQNTQGAVVGNFMSLLGTTLIFATNLHHLAIGAIAGSYRMLPPGGHLPTGDMAQFVIMLTSSSFALGFQLAAPFLVFGFAVYAGLGVLAKLMPQLQIFFVAVPINLMCGFLIMLALIGSLMTVFLTYYTNQMAAFL